MGSQSWGMPDSTGYIYTWIGGFQPEMWLAEHIIPLLLAAGTCRLVYLLIRPRM